MGTYISSRKHSMLFFSKITLARNKENTEGFGTIHRKDLPASFLEIEVLLFHPIDCLSRSNTYPRFSFGDTRSSSYFTSCLAHRISFDAFIQPSTRTRIKLLVDSTFISSKDSVLSAREFRKVRSYFVNCENRITKYRICRNLIYCDPIFAV